MYGTRYGRGDDRGDTSHYRSTGPDSGVPVSGGVSGRQGGRVVRRDWDDDPPVSADRRVQRNRAETSGGYGSGNYRSGGYRSGSVGYGGGSSYRSGQPLPVDPDATVVVGLDDLGGDYPRRGSRSRRPANDLSRRPERREPRRRPVRDPADDDDDPLGRQPAAKRVRRQMPLWQELPLLLIVAFCLAVLIRTFLVQAFFIPSGSMENTLLVGDRVLVNKTIYDYRQPLRGEIVVFSGTDSWVPEVEPETDLSLVAKLGRTVGDLIGVSRPGDKDFIKRVIGLPGDTVSCCDAQGRVLVNGVPLNEPYIFENSPLNAPPDSRGCRSRRFSEVTVPPGQMFVMGDHRLVSQDARCQGPVPIENIIGKAFAIVWPNESWAVLPTPPTFDSVPGPALAAPPAPTDGTRIDGARSVRTPDTGALAVVLPLLLVFPFPARTRRHIRDDRRRLAE